MKDFDFYNDLKNELLNILKESNLRVDQNQSIDKILFEFLNLNFKILEPKTRNVHIAPELLIEIENHPKKHEIEGIIDFAKVAKTLTLFKARKLLSLKLRTT